MRKYEKDRMLKNAKTAVTKMPYTFWISSFIREKFFIKKNFFSSYWFTNRKIFFLHPRGGLTKKIETVIFGGVCYHNMVIFNR